MRTHLFDTRILGTVAMVTSPLMLVEFALAKSGRLPGGHFGLIDAVFGAVYLCGFCATLIGLRRLRITGRGWGSAVLFGIQIALLPLAGVQQVLELARANQNSTLFGLSDAAWPLSHTLMCATGIAVLFARQWRGLRAVLPFLCGLAVPAFLVVQGIAGHDTGHIAFALLTTLSFGLLGYSLRSSAGPYRRSGLTLP